jgi:Domain of unknown function (DUF4129)
MGLEMTSSVKIKALLLLGFLMIVTGMLAASLPQLALKPGMPLPRLENSQVKLTPLEEGPAVAISINKFFIVLFILVLAGSMLYVIYRLTRGMRWKTLGFYLQLILVISVIVGSIIFLITLLPKTQISFSEEMPLPPSAPPATSPLGPVPVVLLWLVGIGLLVGGLLLGIWIFAASRRTMTIDLVQLEAEKARQALLSGTDLKEVIVRCYLQMSLALEQEQGIERKDFMTTREFEHLLEAAGIPHDPIHQLTQLFEAVRYGNWQPAPPDEENAINCLEAIVFHCRETKRTT